MVFQRGGQNAHLVQSIPVQAGILRMHVKKPVGERAQGAQIIHLLPDHMRRIEIQAEAVTGNIFEHTPPDRRTVRQILARGPLVLREKHGAVLNGDAYAMLLRKRDKRFPHGQESRPLLRHRTRRVPPCERIHEVYPKERGGAHDLPEMLDIYGRFVRVGCKRVGIIPESADFHARVFDNRARLPGVRLGKVRRVNVGHARIAAFRLSPWPAKQLHAVVSLRRGRFDHAPKIQLRENSAYEPEFHIGIQRAS